MNKNKFVYSEKIQDQLQEIAGLIYNINCNTELAVFFSFSGHTHQIDLHICENKEKFDVRVATTGTVYLKEYDNDDGSENTDLSKIEERLDEVITNLKSYLPENNVKKI